MRCQALVYGRPLVGSQANDTVSGIDGGAMPFWDKWLRRKDDPLAGLAKLEADFNTLYEARKYADARQLAKEALATAREQLGPQDVLVAKWHQFLGQAYEAAGGYESSASMEYKKAIGIYRLYTGEQDRALATALHHVGVLYGKLGKRTEALAALEEALTLARVLFGDDDPTVIESEKQLERVEQERRLPGPPSPAQQAQQAIVLPQEVAYTGQPLFDFSSQEPTGELEQLIEAYLQSHVQGRMDVALRIATRARSVARQTLPYEHPLHALTLHDLGFMYQGIGDYARAEPLFQEALEIRKRVLGAEHPDYVTNLNNLALLYYHKGDYVQAEALYHEVLEIGRHTFGSEHPHYAASLNNLAGLYQTTGQYSRAEPLFQEALEIRKRVLGVLNLDYANSLHCLGGFYQAMGSYARGVVVSRVTCDHRVLVGCRSPALCPEPQPAGCALQADGRLCAGRAVVSGGT